MPISLDSEFRYAHCIADIKKYTNQTVSIRAKSKSLHKFGSSLLVGTAAEATLMSLPSGTQSETMLTTNGITHVVSAGASDTGTLYYEGHTIADGNLTFGVFSVTLNGRTPVALPTPLARASRSQNRSTAPWDGPVSFYEGGGVTNGVPDDATQVHLILPGLEGNSLKAATSLSAEDYFLLDGVYGTVDERTSAGGLIRLRSNVLGLAPQTLLRQGLHSFGAPLNRVFSVPLIIKPNSDIWMTGISQSGTIEMSGGFYGVLASIV